MSRTLENQFSVLATPNCLKALPGMNTSARPTPKVVELWSEQLPDLTVPTVIMVTPRDLINDRSDELQRMYGAMPLVRMVLLGGTRDKDTLIRSINIWRVARVIPETSDISDVWNILKDVYESIALSTVVRETAQRLSKENNELQNAITALNTAQKHLLHTERLSTVGRLAGGLVTSIRHHLEGLDSFSRIADADCSEETRPFMNLAFDATRSVSALLEEMHGYADSSPQDDTSAVVLLNDLVSRAVSLAKFDTQLKQRIVNVELGSDQWVCVEQYRIYQVLINLLRNAAQATEPGARITVRTYQDAHYASIEIEDEGYGMPESVQTRIFDPFFSTKGEQGMGLGLHLCRLAVERHAGRIECTSKIDVGTTFRIVLPRRLDRAANA